MGFSGLQLNFFFHSSLINYGWVRVKARLRLKSWVQLGIVAWPLVCIPKDLKTVKAAYECLERFYASSRPSD